MARKARPPIHPQANPNRVALFITRGQVLTDQGHGAQLDYCYRISGVPIAAFGSCNVFGTEDNPFTGAQKVEALEIYARARYGANPFRALTLVDIYADEDAIEDWPRYVVATIVDNGLREPTDLVVGSKRDARHFVAYWDFGSLDREPDFHDGDWQVWEHPVTGRRIHVLDRRAGALATVSATHARESLRERTLEYREIVHPALWDYYEATFPAELRIAMRGEQAPDPRTTPIGTTFIRDGDPDRTVWILRADRVWRRRDQSRERMKSQSDL